MNKRGQGLITITTVEYAFLIVLAIFLTIKTYDPVDDKSLNQIKAEDLVLGIESVFLVEGDLNLGFELGDNFFIDEDNFIIKVYQAGGESFEKHGRSKLSLKRGYVFAEDIVGRTDVVRIRKEGKRVVVS